ncbi:hypothetical protein Tco_0085345 [Tanacetum coccineum]
MKQYLALTRGNQAPNMVKPEIGGNVNFEIKSQFIVSHDAVMLRIFHITLTGAAKRCTAKQLEEICNIKQEGDEMLYQAWERYNDLLYKCPTHDMIAIRRSSNIKIKSSSSSKGIAAIVRKLDNLGRDMKKLKENMHAIQVGCQNCEGGHLDKDCPLNEEVKSIKEAKYGKFRCSSPFINGSKYCVGPPRYYIRIDNRPPFREKRPSLEELMNKYLEESTQRRAEMEE